MCAPPTLILAAGCASLILALLEYSVLVMDLAERLRDIPGLSEPPPVVFLDTAGRPVKPASGGSTNGEVCTCDSGDTGDVGELSLT